MSSIDQFEIPTLGCIKLGLFPPKSCLANSCCLQMLYVSSAAVLVLESLLLQMVIFLGFGWSLKQI